MKSQLLALFCVLMTVSCSYKSDPQPVVPPVDDESYQIALSIAGEALEITEKPLLKASSNDLYGVQVYAAEPGTAMYTCYAYGLFDDPDKMSLSLEGKYQYKFEITLIIDGKNQVYQMSGKYRLPFQTDSNISLAPENEFVYSDGISLAGLGSGVTSVALSKTYSRPETDRYYGEFSGYVPFENGTVSVDLMRTVFGMEFSFVNFKEGSVTIQLDGAPEVEITHDENVAGVQRVFTFQDVKAAALSEELYGENVEVTVTWKKTDGSKEIIADKQPVTFRRLRCAWMTITVEMPPEHSENGMGLNLEDDTLLPGDSVQIGGE